MNAFRIQLHTRKGKTGSCMAFILLLTQIIPAQAQSKATDEQIIQLYIVAGMLIFVSLAVLLTAIYTLQVMKFILLKDTQAEEAKVRESLWSRINKRFITGELLPVGQEKNVTLDHVYDGIVELDNHMPPWLKYTFYGTIVFAIIYFINFFSLNLVQTSEQEYVAEMQLAQQQVAEYRKASASSIDENTAKLVKEAALLTQAKSIYDQNCKACHGSAGEGGVGPNLTDEYWLHGGGMKEVFKTIKYGVPQKGMIAWQQKLKPDEIQNVASYILSLQGTKPANAKEPQGDKVASTVNQESASALIGAVEE